MIEAFVNRSKEKYGREKENHDLTDPPLAHASIVVVFTNAEPR